MLEMFFIGLYICQSGPHYSIDQSICLGPFFSRRKTLRGKVCKSNIHKKREMSFMFKKVGDDVEPYEPQRGSEGDDLLV